MSENTPPVRPEHPPATPPPPVRSLIRKLSEVLAAVERVPKRGHNAHFNYDFAREADLVGVVRAELAKRQVMIFPDVEKCETREVPGNKGPLFITRMEVNFTVEDGESGEQRIFKAIGEGEDNHDKGCYKAITGALKYALMKLFLIPTGDDPEASKKPRDQRDPPPVSGSRPEPSSGATATFPNFGRMKGQPIAGAPPNELEHYIGAARKTLADPSKAKYHAKESALIRALEAELSRQRGTGQPKTSTPFDRLAAIAKAHGIPGDRVAQWLKGNGLTDRSKVTDALVVSFEAFAAEWKPTPEDGGEVDYNARADNADDAPF